jgi:dihydrolipoamide dehydrogenase
LEKGNIAHLTADVRLVDGKTVQIDGEEKTFDAVILATGSEPVVLPLPGMDLDGVIDSTDALSMEEIPDTMAIIGGGVIGTEFASLYTSLGTKVSIIEMMDRIVPPMDPAISEMLGMTLQARGIRVHTGAAVKEVVEKDGLTVVFEKNGQTQEVSAQKVLVATGRRPVTDVLEGAKVQVAMDRRFVRIDQMMRTNVDGLYAIGDVTGKSMLAHTAMEQGIRCAEAIMGKKTRPIEYGKIPSCLYTQPEAASCGMTEPVAQEKGLAIEVGIFPLFNNARTLIADQADNTFVKIIAAKDTGELLGAHIFGPYATEMIGPVRAKIPNDCRC